MKNIFIKTLVLVGAMALPLASFAQSSATPIVKFLPLLSGYNVAVPTNATVGIGSTNVLFTAYNGQVLYSLTNNMGNTNSVAADAFQPVKLSPDANGDVVANASLVYAFGNTNLIPQVVTNSAGQWFVVTTTGTNVLNLGNYTAWPLAAPNSQMWMYPATTNYYQQYLVNSTNVVTINIYRAPALTANGASTGGAVPLWETTAGFTTNITTTATSQYGYCALPVGFMQGAAFVKATVTGGPLANSSVTTLLNQLGIVQPQP
jgi:hypothetical protein